MDSKPDNSGDIRDELGRFPKGVSGNPNGRPPGTLSLVSLLKKHLEEVPDGDKRTRAELFIQKTLAKAMKGDPGSEKLVWNYIEGLPKSSVDITSLGNEIKPILVKFIDGKDDNDSAGV